MEVDAITTEVVSIIQDSKYDAPWVVGKFNEALLLIASACRIPGLQGNSPVTAVANTMTAVMPKTYLHDLYMVTTPTYPQGIVIAPNLKELKSISDDLQKGPVAAISLDGRTLNFRPIPEVDEVLTLYFYGKPKELAAGDVFPDYIPEILHKEIFQNYALKEAYMQIEDGIDGNNPNTKKYDGLAAVGIASLVAFYPNAPKSRPEVRRSRSEF
jgi:hypothetical protein